MWWWGLENNVGNGNRNNDVIDDIDDIDDGKYEDEKKEELMIDDNSDRNDD